MTRYRLVIVGALVVAVLTAACGVDSSDAVMTGNDRGVDGDATTEDVDVTFAQNMIPHHGQAIEMATLAEARTENPAILDIAGRIRRAQDPEIEQMRAWLVEWGRQEMPSEMQGMHHNASGMMDDGEMDMLAAAGGDEFDRLFVDMMIRHHEGAIDMAREVIALGADPEVKALAETIIAAQTAEIDEMRRFDGSS